MAAAIAGPDLAETVIRMGERFGGGGEEDGLHALAAALSTRTIALLEPDPIAEARIEFGEGAIEVGDHSIPVNE